MRTYSTQTAIRVPGTEGLKSGKLSGQVLEDNGRSGEHMLQPLLEELKELTAVNRALEKKLLMYQKREAGLRKELINYRLLAESTPAYIYVIQGDRVRTINPCPRAFAGYATEEISKTDLWQVIHPDFQEIVRERCEAYRRGEVSPSVFEIKIITKSGEERWMEINLNAIVYEGHPAVLATARDISGHKRTEEALLASLKNAEEELQAQSRLFQTQKMDTVGQLAGGMAHELNNQLTVIYACVDLYLSRLTKNDPLRRALLRIRNSAQTSANLTRQLLLFGGRNPLFKLPTNLNSIVEELRNVLQRLLGESIAIKLDTSPGLWLVNADVSNIDQAIVNLVLNARDAMPGGGAITIKTENIFLDHAGQQGVAPGSYACVSVSDPGPGIDKADLPHIFEPFFTTKDPGQGTGLGLSVAYGIIKAHSGWIEASSIPGQGSIFRIYLPAILPETPTPDHD